MKSIKVGDLVRISKYGLYHLDHTQIEKGFGHVTRVLRNRRGAQRSHPTVYVCWFSSGFTKPISTAWLEVINESG